MVITEKNNAMLTPLAGANTLRFGAGVDKNNIKLGLGSLMLDLGNGDKIHIEGFNSQDVFNTNSIGRFEFADGKAANDESANAWRIAA